MSLNPAIPPLLELFAPLMAMDFNAMSADQMRAIFDQPVSIGPPIAMAKVDEISIALPGRTLAARLYVPENAGGGLTLFYHGGGWVLGTLATHDGTARALAKASGHAVLSVGYRLAPEHRYPAAADDGYAALAWAAANAATLGIDPARLAVAGDSAGGNIAAAAAIMARDTGGPKLVHQLLIYPVTDANFGTKSYADNGGGNFFLSTAAMQFYWAAYLGDIASQDAPLAAVLQSADLSGLPPATVVTAEYDPLRDEGQAYARRLAEAGVAVDAPLAPGMIHGFFSMAEMIPAAQGWIDHAGANLAAALA
ncbi:MAG: alpha/beta hydrolase [Polymorphobacter sp.]